MADAPRFWWELEGEQGEPGPQAEAAQESPPSGASGLTLSQVEPDGQVDNPVAVGEEGEVDIVGEDALVQGIPFRQVAWAEVDGEEGEIVRGTDGMLVQRLAVGVYRVLVQEGIDFDTPADFLTVVAQTAPGTQAVASDAEPVDVPGLGRGWLVRLFQNVASSTPVDSTFYLLGANLAEEEGGAIVGPPGPPGPTHKTLYHGEGAPPGALGDLDDFYIDTTALFIYGPKEESGWGAGASMKGPAGEDGEPGPQGPAGKDGKEGAAGAAGAAGVFQVARAAGNPGTETGAGSLSPTECTGNKAGKIGVAGALDGVTIAVGDFIMFYNGSTRDGLWEVVQVGSAIEKWLLRRPAGVNTSQTVERSVITVKEGTTFGHQTFAQDSANIILGTTELRFRHVANRDYGFQTTPPTTPAPIKGDRFSYQTVKEEVVWEFVYTGEGALPWKKIGGGALFADATTTESKLNGATAYTNLPAEPLSIVAPLKGDYWIEQQGALFPLTQGTLREARMSYSVGATAAADGWCISMYYDGAGNARLAGDPGKRTRWTGLAAGNKVQEQARVGGAYEANFTRRRLFLDPIQVG